jgi:4-hydroxyphenylpyruvate dioxygenase-like putative hemolysin
MNVIGIDRVIVATDDLEDTVETFSDLLNLKFGELVEGKTETKKGQQLLRSKLNHTGLDIVAAEEESNEMSRFVEEHGRGLYGIGIRVADIDEALNELAEKGIEPEGEAHMGQLSEYFLHPRYFDNVFVILSEYPHGVETNALLLENPR